MGRQLGSEFLRPERAITGVVKRGQTHACAPDPTLQPVPSVLGRRTSDEVVKLSTHRSGDAAGFTRQARARRRRYRAFIFAFLDKKNEIDHELRRPAWILEWSIGAPDRV